MLILGSENLLVAELWPVLKSELETCWFPCLLINGKHQVAPSVSDAAGITPPRPGTGILSCYADAFARASHKPHP